MGASSSGAEMYGEGSWKADEEYREGLQEFSQTHDSGALAREAAEDLDREKTESRGKPKKEGSEEDSEW